LIDIEICDIKFSRGMADELPVHSIKLQSRHLPNNPHRLQTRGHDLFDEADDVVFVVLAVGVVGDVGAFVGGNLVLVDDPVDGAAVAEFVVV